MRIGLWIFAAPVTALGAAAAYAQDMPEIGLTEQMKQARVRAERVSGATCRMPNSDREYRLYDVAEFQRLKYQCVPIRSQQTMNAAGAAWILVTPWVISSAQ
jgi:hypothetical protein